MMKSNLILLALALSSFCAKAQSLYDIDNITEIYITFEDANWDATMDTYYANDADELLFGSCTINGTAYDSVGVSFKGNSTYNASNSKNPLKIKLAEVYDQDHQGFQTLKLSSGKNDPSFVREVLSYEIGRQYMDMPLSNYATVYINGDYYGLFSSSESINGDYMEDHFYCDKDNMRLKCNPASTVSGNGSSLDYLGTDSSSYFNYYELKSDYGWNSLVDLTNQIETNINGIESVLDVDRAIWMLAFNNVLANMDSYSGPFQQNYYLIQDDNGRILPIIWDLNESIGGFGMVNTSGGPPGGLTDLTEMDPFLRENDTDFPLIYYLFSVDRYRKMYLAHVKTMVEENLSSGDYYTRAGELQTIIDAEVQADPNAIYTHTEFTSNLDSQVGGGPQSKYGIQQVLDGRETYLSSHASFALTAPTITSVSPSVAIPTANSTVTITADIQDATYAHLGYRFYKADAFTKVEMFDDGAHNDGAAADGVWGVDVALGAADMQYYIYADNADAGKFSPRRAEHEFYELTLTSGVVINEIMPSNIETAADQDGEYDDWVELYNNTGTAIDLSGYFLSDDVAILNKWIFPTGTSIAANDYLIVWCDNDILQTGLHAGFKLTSNGETLVLSDASMNPINEVTFPEVNPNHTYGRYANGTGGFIPMVPTFEAENSFTSLNVEDEESIQNVLMYPNPANTTVQFDFGTSDIVEVQVYDLSGRLIRTQSLVSNEACDVSNLSTGTYVVVAAQLNWVSKLIVH